MNTTALFFLVLVGLAGCAAPASKPEPVVKPGLVLVPADQAGLYGLGENPSPGPRGTANAALDTRSVQTDSTVSAIQFNRYADPARPRELMHEAHLVYRRDEPPRWKLQASSGAQQILIGPQITDGRGEIKPLVAPELDAYLREQRSTLQREEEMLVKVSESVRQLADQQRRFAEQLAKKTSANDTAPTPALAGAGAYPAGAKEISSTAQP